MRYWELLSEKLGEKAKLLRRSFIIVGDIAIIEIPKELEAYEVEIAKAIMKIHKNVKVVAKRVSITKGAERVRKVKVIHGEMRTETLHKENGCLFKLDVNKVFVNPRMQNERLRVIKQVKEGELVYDLFAGVGFFSIPIAKKAKVVAVDINPHAIHYLKENAMLNKVWRNITILHGDVRDVIKEDMPKGDRIIMNLPKMAEHFLDVAKRIAKEGTIIHFYRFFHESWMWEKAFEWMKEECSKLGMKIEILGGFRCGPFAPRIYRTCIDFKIKAICST